MDQYQDEEDVSGVVECVQGRVAFLVKSEDQCNNSSKSREVRVKHTWRKFYLNAVRKE